MSKIDFLPEEDRANGWSALLPPREPRPPLTGDVGADWLVVGAVFAGLIFAISVVSIPMILDRSVDAVSAGLTSLRLCLTQPWVMLIWGALITLLVVLAMLPGFLGLLVVGPVLGHASWHAYRSAVGAAPGEPAT